MEYDTVRHKKYNCRLRKSEPVCLLDVVIFLDSLSFSRETRLQICGINNGRTSVGMDLSPRRRQQQRRGPLGPAAASRRDRPRSSAKDKGDLISLWWIMTTVCRNLKSHSKHQKKILSISWRYICHKWTYWCFLTDTYRCTDTVKLITFHAVLP